MTETLMQQKAREARSQNITIPDNLDPDALIAMPAFDGEELEGYGAEMDEHTGRWYIPLVCLARYIVDSFDEAEASEDI